tara:strand:+ start:1822 stop:3120 length:1299 start_codon:yes stop_codon:yes gene_type:complete
MSGKNGYPEVAIVGGLRTPFAKQATAYTDLTALELGQLCVRELLERSEVPVESVQQVVYGQVVPSPSAPNIAREIVLGIGMPRSIEAYSVSRACATGYQSTVNVAESILLGRIDVGISGGADSSSDVPITTSKPLTKALIGLSKARTPAQRLAVFRGLGPRDFLPNPPSPTEMSTGLTMGQSAEDMAKLNGISRADQDALSHMSHVNAAKAWENGFYDDLVMPVYCPPKFEAFTRDNNVRAESRLEGYAKLRPAFDRKHGTVTAGNSSPLTDGASALILMNADKARAEGHPILATIKSYAFAALDPADQLLLGPAYAVPLALERAGITLKDLDLIDMHEAFAAQVLSNTKALACKRFAEDKLGLADAVGEIDHDIMNVNGGSIAIGHPFAATGARQIHQTAVELGRRGGGLALVTACAAGGLGAAMVLEVAK